MGSVDAVRARKPKRLPMVLTKPEALQIAECHGGRAASDGQTALWQRRAGGFVVYACESKMWILPSILLVQDGKGEKDRITMLPETLVAPLQEHLVRVKQLHTTDLVEGYGAVYLLYALERKYPNANREWGWQYVFPAKAARWIPARASSAAITWMKVVYRKRYVPRLAWPGSPNTSPAIPCGTRSPRSCWKPATICGPCRNCSGIET